MMMIILVCIKQSPKLGIYILFPPAWCISDCLVCFPVLEQLTLLYEVCYAWLLFFGIVVMN